jgi:hypothetical protein
VQRRQQPVAGEGAIDRGGITGRGQIERHHAAEHDRHAEQREQQGQAPEGPEELHRGIQK